ncbi:MAG: response regulator [Polyangiaceae bacterium]
MNRPLVVIVDDDPDSREALAGALAPDYEVVTFSSAQTALGELTALEPDVIVSDIVMPQMGGFEFRRSYAARFGHRETPFLFMSSLGDDETVVAGLNAGADDFLVKPVPPSLLRARLSALLRRRRRRETSAFRGDLRTTPLTRLLQFCEDKHFTGTLTVDAPTLKTTIRLEGGELDPDLTASQIDEIWELEAGEFLLESVAPRYDELAPSSRSTQLVGRLSTVPVRGQTLEVETTFTAHKTPTVVTVVLARNEPISKTRKSLDADADPATIQSAIDEQHDQAIASLYDRISTLRQANQPSPSSTRPPSPLDTSALVETVADPTPDVETLFDQGFEHARAGDWEKALAVWERGLAVDPSHRTLAVNVQVARRKLNRG